MQRDAGTGLGLSISSCLEALLELVLLNVSELEPEPSDSSYPEAFLEFAV